MQRSRSAFRVLSWMGALWVLSACDQVSQRLNSPAPRQPGTPVQPVTIQPVPNAASNAGTDTAADLPATSKTPPPALPSSPQASPPANSSSPTVAPAPSSRPDQETLSTARLRQSSPLAAPPGGTTTDRNQGR